MDEKRLEEQKQFYEIAQKRAADLDVYMEQYVYRGLLLTIADDFADFVRM